MWNVAIFYIVVLVHVLCQPGIQSSLYLKFISQYNFIHPSLHLSLISGKNLFTNSFLCLFFFSLFQYKFVMWCCSHTCGWYAFTHLQLICRSHTCGWYAVHTLAVDMSFTHLRLICRSHTCSWYVIHTLAVDMLSTCTLAVDMSSYIARAAPMNDIQQLHVIHSAPSVLPQKKRR